MKTCKLFSKEKKMKNNKKKRRRILGILVTIVIFASIIGLGTNAMNKNETFDESYHPFVSEEAKLKYLAFYEEHARNWPVDSESRMVSTSFGQTFVRISGPKDAPPLVLLSGDSKNSLAWIPQVQALSENYRVYAVDNIYDNGRSIYSRPIEKPEDYVQWLDELFIELGLENINLVGFSYGGWQATLYALVRPERLNKLVLISSVGVINPRAMVLVRGMLYYFFPTEFMVTNYLYWFMPDAITKEKSKQVVDTMVTATLLSFETFKKRSFVNPTVISDDDWNNLKVPTLYLVGKNDVMYSAEKAMARLNEVAPNIITKLTTDAGHDLTFIKSNWVNDAILLFLEDYKEQERWIEVLQ
jgi:pimeloyl-ACP methyl ester carboxylesterase